MKNFIYFIECQKERCTNIDTCIYIGNTEKPLETKIRQHLGYVKYKILSQATGDHLNRPGHSPEARTLYALFCFLKFTTVLFSPVHNCLS